MTTNTKMQGLVMDDGYDSAMNGLPREDNPYDRSHYFHKWWDMGWLEHYDKETEKIANRRIRIIWRMKKEIKLVNREIDMLKESLELKISDLEIWLEEKEVHNLGSTQSTKTDIEICNSLLNALIALRGS